MCSIERQSPQSNLKLGSSFLFMHSANKTSSQLDLYHPICPCSYNEICCRASLPVVTAAVAVLVEKKVPSREECGALILLTMGVTVTVFEGKATGSGAGLFLCVAGESCSPPSLSTRHRKLTNL